jgi:hypothetical protein
MRRRDLLKVTGLAAMADFGALEREAEAAGLAAGDATHRGFVDRLPVPSRVHAGPYRATLARRLDADVLREPDLFAGADAHAAVVAPQASLTVGLGGGFHEAVDAVESRGYSRSGTVAGRPLYVRRGRYRQRVVVTGRDVIVAGNGAELAPVESLARAVVSAADAGAVAERLPAVDAALDRLGSGTVLSVSPTAAGQPGGADGEDGASGPLATGERLWLRAPVARYRSVAVYPSPAAATTAIEDSAGPAAVGDGTVVREGRTVVRDRTVPTPELPLSTGADT